VHELSSEAWSVSLGPARSTELSGKLLPNEHGRCLVAAPLHGAVFSGVRLKH